jgi:hypothetical protein
MQQHFIDTVSQLPELKVLRFFIVNFEARKIGVANFRPTTGLRYVEQLVVSTTRYMLEKDGRYREIPW